MNKQISTVCCAHDYYFATEERYSDIHFGFSNFILFIKEKKKKKYCWQNCKHNSV